MRTTKIRGLVAAAAVVIGGLTLLAPAPAQASAPLKWAVSDGSSMTRSSGATGFTKLGTGQYEVTFGSNVSQCAYVASTIVSSSQALTVFTAGGHLSANGVYVETKNQGGGLSDAPFSLFVSCDDTGNAERHAVVDTNGNLDRGSAGTTRDQPRHAAATRCSSTARPPTARRSPPSATRPTGSSSAPRASTPPRWRRPANAVYVETKNPGGGLSAGIPFHLALVCNDAPLHPGQRQQGRHARSARRRLTSSFRNGPGAYTVVAPTSLADCAWLTTRGETDRRVPFNPTTVEVAAGPAANTVTISEKSLLFFGGAPASEAFQFVAAC